MNTILQWFIPCYFNRNDNSEKEIILDITDSIKTIFANDISSKKIEYGYNHNLKKLRPSQIESVEIKILPRFISGYVNENRIIEYVESNSNKVYGYFKADGYKRWHYALGVVCIKITLNYKTSSIPTRKQVQDFSFDENFLDNFHQNRAILKEVSSIFLSALHITFPTRSIMKWNDNPINDGIMHFNSANKNFFAPFNTDSCMHHVLIVEERIDNLLSNIQGLSLVWHLNLWSLKRYLISVKSNLTDMDNLLDLIYSLEGLFEKSATSDLIKIFCCVHLSKNSKEAKQLKSKLDKAFKIRNEIAHGGLHYNGYEKIKLDGKDILSQDIYWDMKEIVSQMLVIGISKLINNKDMKNLNFVTDDLFEKIYRK